MACRPTTSRRACWKRQQEPRKTPAPMRNAGSATRRRSVRRWRHGENNRYYRPSTFGGAMSRFLIGIASTVLLCWAASAETNMDAANVIMPGCRAIVAERLPNSMNDAYLQGYCMGIVVAVSGFFVTCKPNGVTNGQVVRIVVKYIDERPERMH